MKKIHKYQIISKSSNPHLWFIVKRLYDIGNYLKTLKNQPRFTHMDKIDTIFEPHIVKNKRQYLLVLNSEF